MLKLVDLSEAGPSQHRLPGRQEGEGTDRSKQMKARKSLLYFRRETHIRSS